MQPKNVNISRLKKYSRFRIFKGLPRGKNNFADKKRSFFRSDFLF